MDAETKEQFKWKFYQLTMELNAVILLAALTVIALFIIPEPFRLTLFLVLIVLVAFLSFHFVKKYRETKAWLDQHTVEEKPE